MLNEPLHPVQELAYWDTPAEETQAMQALFDAFAGTDPEQRKKLLSLMEWAGEQRAADEAYNSADFSGY